MQNLSQLEMQWERSVLISGGAPQYSSDVNHLELVQIP